MNKGALPQVGILYSVLAIVAVFNACRISRASGFDTMTQEYIAILCASFLFIALITHVFFKKYRDRSYQITFSEKIAILLLMVALMVSFQFDINMSDACGV